MNQKERLKRAYDGESFRVTGHALVDLIADYLEQAQNRKNYPVLPDQSPGALLEKYRSLLEGDKDLVELFRSIITDSNHLHHPGYMGHQVCAPLPVTALSGLLGTLLNNGSAVYEMGMSNVAMEKTVIDFTARKLGMPEQSDGIMTSGGSLGNLTALLAARQQMAGHDAWNEGSGAGEQPVILVPQEAHYSIDKAVRIMGHGAPGTEIVPCNEQFAMDAGAIPGIIEKVNGSGRRVIAVVASAGSTATGAYDPLEEVAAVCREYKLWFHVDGAHGAPAVFSEPYRHLAAGIEKADSVVIDYHKMGMTPGLNTAVIFREGQHSYETFAQKASYLFSRANEPEWYTFAKRTVECTKSMMGFHVYAILYAHGPEVFDANVTRLYDLSREFYAILEAEKDMEVAHRPESNILCFRYHPEGSDEPWLNRVNPRIHEQINREGAFFIVQTTIGNSWYLRTALMNPLTNRDDLLKLVRHVRTHGKSIGSAGNN